MGRSAQKNKRILVVDDDIALRNLASMSITSWGFDVMTAMHGTQALSLINSTQFDMVITDFQMPIMNGRALASIIKQKVPDLPIIMMTGCQDELISNNLDDEPFDYLLLKPFSLMKLKTVVNNILCPNAT